MHSPSPSTLMHAHYLVKLKKIKPRDDNTIVNLI